MSVDQHNAAVGPQDRATVRIAPPLYFAVGIVAGVVFDRWGVPAPSLISNLLLQIALGVVVAAIGVACAALAIAHFKRTGQDPAPWTSTPALIHVGIYRHTRNPMYIGLTLLHLGIGIGLDNLWIVLLAAPAAICVHYFAVLREEAYLELKFGAAYLSYKSSVRRWLV